MKVLSLFSGVGAFEMALKRLEVDFELVNYCEIDKFASKSYSAIHGAPEDKNLWDVTTINTDTLPDFDLMTWGFPCQDISVAGKGAGIEKGTRSGLYYEGLRILQDKKPMYSIVENVKNLVGKKFKDKYLQMLEDFDEAGYNSYSRVLNAKDYGIPQNRERVFIVSIRQDVDPYANTIEGYPWPQPFDNGLRLKDFLEDEVDEKFYISEEKTAKLIEQLKESGSYHSQEYSYAIDSNYFKGPSQADLTNGKRQTVLVDDQGRTNKQLKPLENCPTLRAQDHGNPPKVIERQDKIQYKEMPNGDIRAYQNDAKKSGVSEMQITNSNNESPTITTAHVPKVIEGFYQSRPPRTFDECPTIRSERNGLMATEPNECNCIGRIDLQGHDQPMFSLTTQDRHGVMVNTPKPELVGGVGEINFGKQYRQGNRIYSADKTAMALMASPVGNTGGNSYLYAVPGFRIRKLTPRECWRLMGFTDTDFDKAQQAGISNSQLYKQAGNSIVVDVLVHIMAPLFSRKEVLRT